MRGRVVKDIYLHRISRLMIGSLFQPREGVPSTASLKRFLLAPVDTPLVMYSLLSQSVAC